MKYTTRILLLLFCLSLSYSAFAQTITESDYSAFMNSIGGPDSGKRSMVENEASDIDADTNTLFHGNRYDANGKGDTLFTVADIKYMKGQLARTKNHTWKNGEINWADIESTKTINALFHKEGVGGGWTKFQEKYHTHAFYDYSIPIFSSNKLLCAIYRGEHCGGLCGSGDICVYQYKGGKWVLIRYYNMWVS